jgi:hypothetical protein
MKPKDSLASQALAEMAAIRKKYTAKVSLLNGSVLIFNLAILVATWGNGLATFIVVISLFITVREFLRTYLTVKWMHSEEERIRRFEEYRQQSTGDGDER